MTCKILKRTPFFCLCLSSLLLFSAQTPLWAQEINIKITDCQSGEPLGSVYIVDGDSRLLGESDASGFVRFTASHWPIFLERQGYQTKAIYEKANLQTVTCLLAVKNKLPTVEVKAKKANLKKYLLKLRDKNLPLFIHHDTTTFYHFTYTLQFPQKHWQEKASGYIAYHWQRHKRLPTEATYVQYHYSCSDTAFWQNKAYQAARPNGVYHVLRYNLMGNDDGYQLWKRLVNKENNGINIPIPTFLLSKEQRAELKKINDNPEKYHLAQYVSEKRRLSLRLDSLNNRIFETHYSNYDTTGYIAEKLIFDNSDRLKTVIYYTPEQMPTRYIPLDSVSLNSVHRISKINNDSSYYYSKYTYDVSHKPILLQQARHLETFYVNNQRYRIAVRLNVVDTPPKEDFNITAYYWNDSKNGAPYFGLEKGEDVLKAIKEETSRQKTD